jgi:hypothetical protein
MTTVDHTLMRGSKPHDRRCVVELPRSRNLPRVDDRAWHWIVQSVTPPGLAGCC